MGKPLQQDENGNIMNDVQTQKNQKGYSNYEKDLENSQKRREAKDESMMETINKAKEKIRSVLPFKSGGFVDHNMHVKKHAAGFKHHDDHVKAMCGGGMAKGKRK